MVVTEYYKTRRDGVILDKTYSDEGYYIISDLDHNMYEQAIDPRDLHRTYTESDVKIPEPPEM